MLKKKDICILFLINLFVFFCFTLFSKINCVVVLQNPKYQTYSAVIGTKQVDTDVLNGEYLEIKLPFLTSGFTINNLKENQIRTVFLNGNEIYSLNNISNVLLKFKINTLFKVFALTIGVMLFEIILISLFFIPQKDKFWENLIENKTVFYISCLILCVFIIWNFYNIYQTAVDLPFWDEWEALNPGRLDEHLNFSWLFAQHNEHKILWTRLYTWILYHLDGWNLRHQIILNFFLYLTSLFVLYKVIPDKNSLLPLFFIPCFSDVLIDNQLTGFQSQFYFMLLFSYLAIYFGFVKENSYKNAVLFSVFSVCAMLSMTFISGVALFFAYFMKERKFNINVVTSAGVILVGLFLFFINYTTSNLQMEVTMPYKPVFWYYYFRIILKGIFNVYLPVLCTLLSGILFVSAFIISYIKDKDRNSYYVYFSLFILCFALTAGVAAGRCSIDTSYIVASRHLNVVNFLIPCIAAMLIRFKQVKISLIYFILLICMFAQCYTFDTYYGVRDFRIQAKKELLMVVDSTREELTVGKVNPFNIKECILRAKDLNVSFLRKR